MGPPQEIRSMIFEIHVWAFEYAPKKYQDLSPHGGDEDWLAFVPEEYGDRDIRWLESGTPFGYCDVSRHKVEGGTIYIGAHS